MKEQLASTISHLHSIFESHVFIACCRGYWDKMGQVNKLYPDFFIESGCHTKSKFLCFFFDLGCPELLRKQERESGMVQGF